jgi:FkbM family methyltransferase
LKRKKFTSQIGQDKWVLQKTNFKRGGFFLEIGSADGLYLSNTYILEKKFGWKGICVEPANKISELKRNRKCVIENSCISSKTGEIVDFQVDDEISGIKEYFDKFHERKGQTIKVKTISLKDLFVKHNAPKVIDFFSLDTEGSEYEILKNFPFKDYQLNLITVEHNAHSGKKEDIERRQKIFDLLTKNGFVREEHSEFSKKFGDKDGGNFEDWYVNTKMINHGK